MKKTSLDETFESLKKYASNKDFEALTKRIFELNLPKTFLKTLTQDQLAYIHVKLHNANYYKKPFAPMKNIKKSHGQVAMLLNNHCFVDELDK